MTRFFSILSVLATIGLTSASPLFKRAVSAAQFSQFTLIEQWAAAAYCPANDEADPGVEVECSAGNCPIVQADNTTILLAIPSTILTDTAGFVALDHTNKLIVTSFRGTETVRNYLTDVNFTWLPAGNICPGCNAFAGIYTAWLEVSSRVIQTVQQAQQQYPDYRAQSAGHSLGGGIATIAVAALRNAGIVTDMVTFGAPRVGDETFVQYVMAQSPSMGENYRVTHIYDPVPSLPPLLNGFRHVSPSYFITVPGTTPVTAADIIVQEGTTVENPWGSSIEEDTEAHSNYMGLPISICYPQDIGISFRRMVKRS